MPAIKVGTWNTQGDKRAKIAQLMFLHNLDVFCIQEAGAVADLTRLGNLYVFGLNGVNSDGYRNNRVSLAIVTGLPVANVGFVEWYDRGLLWVKILNGSNSFVFGSWHEKRRNGGLAGAIQSGINRGYLSADDFIIVGGDFNDENYYPVWFRIGREQWVIMESDSVDGPYTHQSGNDLDRIYVSANLAMNHQMSSSVSESDHNPVFGYVSIR